MDAIVWDEREMRKRWWMWWSGLVVVWFGGGLVDEVAERRKVLVE